MEWVCPWVEGSNNIYPEAHNSPAGEQHPIFISSPQLGFPQVNSLVFSNIVGFILQCLCFTPVLRVRLESLPRSSQWNILSGKQRNWKQCDIINLLGVYNLDALDSKPRGHITVRVAMRWSHFLNLI